MLPIAFTIALIVNTAGISGAALFVPFFILIFPHLTGFELETTNSVKLGLITESFGLSSSALAFWVFGLTDGIIAKKALLFALPMVIIGAIFTSFIPSSILYFAVAVLLTASAVLLWLESRIKAKRLSEHGKKIVKIQESDPRHHRVTKVCKDGTVYHYMHRREDSKKIFWGYSIGGLFQGANGFGVGELGVMSLFSSSIPTRIAIGTSHVIIAVAAIIAALTHFAASLAIETTQAFPWNIPIMTIPAVIIAGQVAPHLAARIPAKYLEKFVSMLFIVIAGGLILLVIS